VQSGFCAVQAIAVNNDQQLENESSSYQGADTQTGEQFRLGVQSGNMDISWS